MSPTQLSTVHKFIKYLNNCGLIIINKLPAILFILTIGYHLQFIIATDIKHESHHICNHQHPKAHEVSELILNYYLIEFRGKRIRE